MPKPPHKDNPLLSTELPPPPQTEQFTTPSVTGREASKTETGNSEAEAGKVNQEPEAETKITIVLNADQAEKIIALKVEYQKRYRKWLSDTEFMRRLIEGATLEAIVTPSAQVRQKQGRKAKQ